ncbi:hypothetical protein YWY31_51980 [Paenibacillus illinoisensis]
MRNLVSFYIWYECGCTFLWKLEIVKISAYNGPKRCEIRLLKHLHVTSVLGRIDVGLKKLTRDILGP